MTLASAWAQPAKPLARLANGEVVSEQDLSDYLDRRMDLRQIARNAWGVEGTVQEMAMTRVLVLEGERLQFPRKVEEGTPPLRFDDIYGLAVYKKQAPACEAPANEQESRQYYDAHPQAFVLPTQARVERIILPASTQIGDSSAMAWLQDQARAVIQGQRKFALVAMRAQGEYSLDAQGDLGWLTLDGDHTLMRALKTVKAGELLGPVQDGEFVYLFSVLQKREARQLSWDEAKSFAANRAVSHCRQEAQTQMRADLFKRYGVEIDRIAIREFMARANSVAGGNAADKADAKSDEKADAKPQQ
ncbi:hypothetical protein A1D30_08680 [Acidovorax sp. GW101-3H11]|nr:hypothetical protein A1D30_08680 [Acidovorax sp. GW101-3H11]